LVAGEGAVELPGGAAVRGAEGIAHQDAAGDVQGGGPGGAVGGPLDGGIGLEGGSGLRQGGLAPTAAAVPGVEDGERAVARDVVRRGDDLVAVPEVDADVRLAARRGLGAGDFELGAAGEGHGRLRMAAPLLLEPA